MKPVYVLAAILIFGFLIAIHEFGHFIAAKLCGIRVNEFSVGMGPLIFQREKGETIYSLRAFPAGGYCAMEGEDEDTGDARSFVRQSFWKKLFVLIAGALMNFIAGVIIIAVLFGGAVGFNVDRVAGLAPEFRQIGEDGLMDGDRVYKINGYRTYLAGDSKLFLDYAGDTVDMEVVRDGRHIVLEDISKQTCTGMNGETYQGFGIYVGYETIPATAATWIKFVWYQALDFVQTVWFSLVQLVRGSVGVDEISGPVGIVSTMTEVGETAHESGGIWAAVWNTAYFAALLTVNLAVMNLLPVPALDGGRIFFLVVDMVSLMLFKRKVPEKYQAIVNGAGFFILMGFMLIITFQDVFKLFE